MAVLAVVALRQAAVVAPEGPGIDNAYMAVTQAITGSGGWPMSVVMTPDKKPFFAGTYFPKEGAYGRPGMMELVPGLAKAWSEQREKVVGSADQIVGRMRAQSAPAQTGKREGAALKLACSHRAPRFDAKCGGFSQQPKFPVPHNIRLLLRYHKRTGDAKALEMVETTLWEMRKGGIYDHVGFGFHRYSTDQKWLVPHFEKMLHDQALLAMAYTEAFQATGNAEYRRTAEEILAYGSRDMTDSGGGFFSAEDTDSQGVEGLFYLWTAQQITDVLGAEDGKLWSDIYGVKTGGNVRDETSGGSSPRNILNMHETRAESAARLDTTEPALRARFDTLREKLLAVRSKRIRPLRDDKVLTDRNGLMISAYARAAQALDKPEYAAAANRAADFVLASLRDKDGRLLKRWRGCQGGHYATLEDYAFFIGGLLDLYEASFDADRLEQALAVAKQMDEHFAAPEGGYYLGPDDGEKLFVRSR